MKTKLLFLTLINCTLFCHCRWSAPVDRPAVMGAARWITDDRPLSAPDSLQYENYPAPLFRKPFSVASAGVKRAVLKITAAGYYTASLNGKKIGDTFLDPAWTHFAKRVYYSEFDVSENLNQGENCLGIVLGNGFYNPLPLRMWGYLNLREKMTVGKPACVAQLIIHYDDGHEQQVVTDSTWMFAYGPVVRNNVYLGMVYDARQELGGWDTPGYDAANWSKADVTAGPGGKLEKTFFPAIKNTRSITPLRVTRQNGGRYLVDMGENFSGLYAIAMQGRPGDSVVFRFGERIHADGTLNPMTSVCGQIKSAGQGGPGAPAVAWQSDAYVFASEQRVHFVPDFTFHTFRYLEITGLRYQPDLADIRGLVLHTDVDQCNHFECSSERLNAIQNMTTRTFLCNLFSVQSDCPARERFGYGGDLNAVSEAYIYNFDMRSFYRKTIYDWMDAVKDTCFVDTAPFVGLEYCGISWESALLITQYNLYLYYNDIELVRDMYPFDLAWMEKVKRIHGSGLVEKGLSDHEALIPSSVQLTGTVHYLQCSRIMARFAQLLHDSVHEKKFDALADSLGGKLKTRFWDKPVEPSLNRQTLFASLLYQDIIPPSQLAAATDSLKSAMEHGPASHFSTGIFGTKYILEAASRQGMAETVFNIVNSRQFPGWGFMVDRGATTIWETWKESDNIYSNCHPMFGSVSEWFYRWLAGIQPNPDYPGFQQFTLAPHVPVELDYVKCSYRSPHGTIQSNWQKDKNGLVFSLVVPQGSKAHFIFPIARNTPIQIACAGKDGVEQVMTEEPVFQRELEQGSYTIAIAPTAARVQQP